MTDARIRDELGDGQPIPAETPQAAGAGDGSGVSAGVGGHTHRPSRFARYWRPLWLLTERDLRVRYSTSFLGYFWSILDPLIMAGIYWFVFTQVFHRTGVHQPYIVFLLSALLPWMWFIGAISDSTRAFFVEAKLVRSTRIPRTIWVNRLVLSKGIEFIASLPVLALFALVFNAPITADVVYFPLAVVIQTVLMVGLALLVAPLAVFVRDLDQVVRLGLRFFFYASPIIYSSANLPAEIRPWIAINPLSGILSLYRAAFFPDLLDWRLVATSAIAATVFLAAGVTVFLRSERALLKEL